MLVLFPLLKQKLADEKVLLSFCTLQQITCSEKARITSLLHKIPFDYAGGGRAC